MILAESHYTFSRCTLCYGTALEHFKPRCFKNWLVIQGRPDIHVLAFHNDKKVGLFFFSEFKSSMRMCLNTLEKLWWRLLTQTQSCKELRWRKTGSFLCRLRQKCSFPFQSSRHGRTEQQQQIKAKCFPLFLFNFSFPAYTVHLASSSVGFWNLLDALYSRRAKSSMTSSMKFRRHW